MRGGSTLYAELLGLYAVLSPLYEVVRALYAVHSSFASLCGSEPICLDSGYYLFSYQSTGSEWSIYFEYYTEYLYVKIFNEIILKISTIYRVSPKKLYPV
jgi:hypothetical protein